MGPGDYTVSSGGKGVPLLRCEIFREHSPIRSNLAVAEEVARQARYFVRDPLHDPFCKNPESNLELRIKPNIYSYIWLYGGQIRRFKPNIGLYIWLYMNFSCIINKL
jgi:hypothetical protein